MKNYIQVQLLLCYSLLLWSSTAFPQAEVLQKEIVFARPNEFFSPTFSNLQMELDHNVLLVYKNNFDWTQAIDSGIFIDDYNIYDFYSFFSRYREAIRRETEKPSNSSELLNSTENSYLEDYNTLKVKASRYWRKNSDLLFDMPTFELFRANIDYILLGEEKIWIPNFSYKGCRKQQDAYYVSVNVYAIVNVTAFEPISKEEADVWLKN